MTTLMTLSGHTAHNFPGCPQRKRVLSNHHWVLSALGQPSAFLLPIFTSTLLQVLLLYLFFPFVLSGNNTLTYSQAFTLSTMSMKMSTKAVSPFLFPFPGTHLAFFKQRHEFIFPSLLPPPDFQVPSEGSSTLYYTRLHSLGHLFLHPLLSPDIMVQVCSTSLTVLPFPTLLLSP